MEKALVGVVAIGLVIGLVWPGEEKAADAPAPVAASAQAPVATQAFTPTPPVETRLTRQDNGHFYVYAEVNGQPVQFLVDTGASTVALTEADARRIGLIFSPGEYAVIGKGAAGEVRGKLVELASVSVEGKTVTQVRGAIIEGGTMSLLGQSYLSRIGSVSMSGGTMTLR